LHTVASPYFSLILNIYFYFYFFLCPWAYYTVFSGAGVISGTLHPAEWDTHFEYIFVTQIDHGDKAWDKLKRTLHNSPYELWSSRQHYQFVHESVIHTKTSVAEPNQLMRLRSVNEFFRLLLPRRLQLLP
jgi:hypothetical protein